MPFNNEVNPGTRNVDTQQLVTSFGPFTSGFPGATGPSLSLASKIYVGDAVSFAMTITPLLTDGNLVSNTVEIYLVWFAADGATITGVSIYELLASNSPVNSYVSDRTKGAYVDIWLTANDIIAGMSPLTSIAGNLVPSSKPIDKLRIAQQPVFPTEPPISGELNVSGDGLIWPSLNYTGLAVNASTPLIVTPTLYEDYVIQLNGGPSGAIIRMRGGIGARGYSLGGAGVFFTYVTGSLASINQPDIILGPFPPITRPLVFNLTNIGTVTASAHVGIWQKGN